MFGSSKWAPASLLAAGATAAAVACGGQVSRDPAADRAAGEQEPAAAGAAATVEGDPFLRDFPCPELAYLTEDVCAYRSFEWQHLSQNILLVVDGSESMRSVDPGQTLSRWETVHETLAMLLPDLGADFDLGLELYPDATGAGPPTGCDAELAQCCEIGQSSELTLPVRPGAQAAAEIISLLGAYDPAGASPTAAALARALDYFADPGVVGADFVLLVTDGGANCHDGPECSEDSCTFDLEPEGCAGTNSCCASLPSGCLDTENVRAQIERLRTAGVIVAVAGVAGHERYAAALDQWARAAEFGRPDDASGYFELSLPEDSEMLLESFDPYTFQEPGDCEVPLLESSFNPNRVEVILDCEWIPYATFAQEGGYWHYNNPDAPTSVILDGSACDAIENWQYERIDVLYGCPIPLDIE